MKMRYGDKTMLRSMKEFENEYYPKSLSGKSTKFLERNPNFGKDLAEKTMEKIKRKFF